MRDVFNKFFHTILFPFRQSTRWGVYYFFQIARLVIIFLMWIFYFTHTSFYLPFFIIASFAIDFVDGGIVFKFTDSDKYRVLDTVIDAISYLSLFYFAISFWTFFSVYFWLWLFLYFPLISIRFFYPEVVVFKPASNVLFIAALATVFFPEGLLFWVFLIVASNPVVEYLIHMWEIGEWKTSIIFRMILTAIALCFYTTVAYFLFLA